MQNGKNTIQGLFNGDRIFNIPKYQRAYSWTYDNLASFLDDLLNQRSDKNYFLGTFLFHQQKNRGEYELLDVVDGQQRITTFIIFIKYLIAQLNKYNSNKTSIKTYHKYIKDRDSVFKLELENEDNGFLHGSIFGDEKRSRFETPSQKALFNAKEFFEKELSNYSMEKLEKIFDISINADILLYVVNDISDAIQIFELLNDRGKKLTNLESIKSFLMYRIGCLKLKDKNQPIDDIQSNFASIYRIIENSKINESDVIRYHTIAFEKSKVTDYDDPEKYIKVKINKMFENEIDDIKIKTLILNYVGRLKRSFDIFKIINDNEMKCNDLDKLVMIGRVNPFYPLMMIIYSKQEDKFEEFITNLIKFTFRSTLVSLRSNGESDFYRNIRDKEDLIAAIKLPVVDNWWNINSRVKEFLNYRNFYEWVNNNIVKYILFAYENSLRENKGYPLLGKLNYFETDERTKLSIEHITAQKADIIEFDDEFKEDYLHSIGNLVIDTKSSNSRKGKNPVNIKIDDYAKAPIMSQNEIDNSKTNWDDIDEIKSFIDHRNKTIINFIKSNLL